MRRALWSSKHGPKPSTARIGGIRAASRSRFAKSTFGHMEHFDGSTAPTEWNTLLQAHTAKSQLQNGSCSRCGIIPSRPDQIATLIFSEEGGKTKLTMTIECKSVGDRDALLQMRIDVGTARTLENLAEYLDRRRPELRAVRYRFDRMRLRCRPSRALFSQRDKPPGIAQCWELFSLHPLLLSHSAYTLLLRSSLCLCCYVDRRLARSIRSR